ncbi:MAG: D-aminoacylase, partial [bacterium]|nr:D-aminoacylase [bacterium]
NPWFAADVAVADGKIAAVGNLINADAERVIDARERYLAPGFIDVHTHSERTIAKVPLGDNFVFDGVTTVVTGNCGGSKTDLAAWFTELEEIGLGINFASLVGHNSVRAVVVGRDDRPATPEELERMQQLVADQMKAGAVGFSTGLIYTPGTYAPTEEIVALAKAAGRRGGVYATHMRDEGTEIIEAIQEAITVGREADLPVQVSHFKISSKHLWGGSGKTIALIEKARDEGIDIVVDQYPYDRSSTSLNITLPTWALSGGSKALRERLQDAETRARIATGMEEELRRKGQDDYSYAMVAAFEKDRSLEGKTISEINELRGRPKTLANEILTIMEILNQGGAGMVYHSMSNEDVERIMRYPHTTVASDGGTRVFGDGKPHPRSYGTNARVLARFVRDRGVLRIEDAIRRMTSLPARTFSFRDRGQIREGMAADLVLFDHDLVEDKATFQQPHQFSDGFDLVLVNGQSVVEDGKLTGRRAGVILRHESQ